MNVTVRIAVELDAEAMVAILNPIIDAGIHTIMDGPVTNESQRAFIRSLPDRSVCHVAMCSDTDHMLGLQDVLPASTATALSHVGEISTFIALDARRQGIGRLLTSATIEAARAQGYHKVLANIRTDNSPALAFYECMGFEVIGVAHRHAVVGGRYVDATLTERWIGPAVSAA